MIVAFDTDIVQMNFFRVLVAIHALCLWRRLSVQIRSSLSSGDRSRLVSLHFRGLCIWKQTCSWHSAADIAIFTTEVRSEIQKHELRADSDRRSIQELTGIIDSQRMEIDHALQDVSNPGEINYFFINNYQNKIEIFVEFISGICETWKNCRKVTC